jgi:hypothetical protein
MSTSAHSDHLCRKNPPAPKSSPPIPNILPSLRSLLFNEFAQRMNPTHSSKQTHLAPMASWRFPPLENPAVCNDWRAPPPLTVALARQFLTYAGIPGATDCGRLGEHAGGTGRNNHAAVKLAPGSPKRR